MARPDTRPGRPTPGLCAAEGVACSRLAEMDTGPAQRPAAFPAVTGPRVTVALIDIVVATPLAPTIPNSHVEPIWDRCGKAVCHGRVGGPDRRLPRAEHVDPLEQGLREDVRGDDDCNVFVLRIPLPLDDPVLDGSDDM